MATNYSLYEAVEIIDKQEDVEAVMEIGRRFPLLTVTVAKALAGSKEAIFDLLAALPEYTTANKVHRAMKEAAGSSDEGEEKEEKPAKKAPAKKAAKKAEPEDEEDDEYADKNAMDLFKECKKRGLKAAPKKPKKYYVDLLKKADASAEEADDDDWDEEEDEKPAPKKAAKKPAKKAEPEDDDDDEDWDI